MSNAVRAKLHGWSAWITSRAVGAKSPALPCKVGLQRLRERRARVDVGAGLVGRRPEERERAGIVRVDDAEPPAGGAPRTVIDAISLARRPALLYADREADVSEAAEAGGRVPAADSGRDRRLRRELLLVEAKELDVRAAYDFADGERDTPHLARAVEGDDRRAPDEIAVAGTARSSGWNVPEKCAAAGSTTSCSRATAARSRSRTRRGRRCAARAPRS